MFIFVSCSAPCLAQMVSLASCPQPQIGLSTYKIQGSKPAVFVKLFKLQDYIVLADYIVF